MQHDLTSSTERQLKSTRPAGNTARATQGTSHLCRQEAKPAYVQTICAEAQKGYLTKPDMPSCKHVLVTGAPGGRALAVRHVLAGWGLRVPHPALGTAVESKCNAIAGSALLAASHCAALSAQPSYMHTPRFLSGGCRACYGVNAGLGNNKAREKAHDTLAPQTDRSAGGLQTSANHTVRVVSVGHQQ